MNISLHFSKSNEDLFNELKAAFDESNIKYDDCQDTTDTVEAEGISGPDVQELIIVFAPLITIVVKGIIDIIRDKIKNKKFDSRAENYFIICVNENVTHIHNSKSMNDVEKVTQKIEEKAQ